MLRITVFYFLVSHLYFLSEKILSRYGRILNMDTSPNLDLNRDSIHVRTNPLPLNLNLDGIYIKYYLSICISVKYTHKCLI